MSRKYMNDRWCVRCNRCEPAPYVVKHFDKLVAGLKHSDLIADVGCGNGRNSKFFVNQGYMNVKAFDMVREFGLPFKLGTDTFPIMAGEARVILANYVLMFLSPEECQQVMGELQRIAGPRCRLMVELYPAKDSRYPDDYQLEIFKNELNASLTDLGWITLHIVKHKFIMENANGK